MPLKECLELFSATKDEALEWLYNETATLRSGRVKPDLVETIQVEYWGTRSPLNSLATISSTDARTLVISPFDKNAIKGIEKAITEANLGVQPMVDGNVIRLSFPSLTEDIRQQTLKTLLSKAEEARVRLRQGRDDALRQLREDKEAVRITEDEWYNGKKQLDDAIDKSNEEIEAIIKKKEAEIVTI